MVSLDVTYERADYVRAIRFMSRRQNRLFNSMLCLGAVIFILLLFVRPSAGDFELWTAVTVPVMMVAVYLLLRALQVRSVARQLQNAPDARCPQHWEISEAGIASNSELSSSQMKWDAVIRFRESKTDFFFYTAPRFAKFIPKRAVPEEQQRDELRRLAAQNIADSRA